MKNVERFLSSELHEIAKAYVTENNLNLDNGWERGDWCKFVHWLFSERAVMYTIQYKFIDNDVFQQFKVRAITEKEAMRQFHSKMDPVSYMLEHDASGSIMVRIDHD